MRSGLLFAGGVPWLDCRRQRRRAKGGSNESRSGRGKGHDEAWLRHPSRGWAQAEEVILGSTNHDDMQEIRSNPAGSGIAFEG
jgi:hypothetical protein